MVTIHYCALYRKGVRASCGSHMRADTDRFTSDPDSTDCMACMATDEYKARSMEATLLGPEPISAPAREWSDYNLKPKPSFTPPHRKRPR